MSVVFRVIALDSFFRSIEKGFFDGVEDVPLSAVYAHHDEADVLLKPQAVGAFVGRVV